MRRGGETGWERVAAQREGRREWAGLEGKEARRLLGWVEVDQNHEWLTFWSAIFEWGIITLRDE
jgi:hypothetical protein